MTAVKHESDSSQGMTGPSNPLVSVLMLTYNHEKYISTAIESILKQKSDVPFELIIADDCSMDRTRDICAEYQQRYPDSIQLCLHQSNLGIQQNFLQTVILTRGQYIAFCEGDDFWILPEKLQMQVDYLNNNPSVSGVHTKVDYVDADNEIVGSSRCPGELSQAAVDFNVLLQKNIIHTCSFMFRKNVLNDQVYLVLSKTPIPDYALFLATALKGKIGYLPYTTAAYRKNAGVSSTWIYSSLIKYRLQLFRLMERYFDVSTYAPALYAARQYQYFHLYAIPRKGRENLVRCLYFFPLVWYTLLLFACRTPDNRQLKFYSFIDVLKLLFRSRFRLKNWRQYLVTSSNRNPEK